MLPIRHDSWTTRVAVACALLVAAAAPALAGKVTGELELSAPAGKPPLRGKAYLDRIENPYKAPRDADPFPYMIVVLEGDAAKMPEPPPQEAWDLVGDRFDRPLIAVVPGSEVLIRNKGRGTPTLMIDGHADLLPHSPLNPRGERGFKAGAAGTLYELRDEDTPHITGGVVVVATPYHAIAMASAKDARKGSFSLSDVPDGTWTLRIWYRTGWLDGVEQTVEVKGSKTTSVSTIKIPAGLPTAASK
ncbi:MAG: hypothetical protein KC464_08510 [Myxococcales bacterium]|nr:hypothetical protein [Myxococcales bacterium]